VLSVVVVRSPSSILGPEASYPGQRFSHFLHSVQTFRDIPDSPAPPSGDQ